MGKSEILCHNCDSLIVEYYDEGYKGKRGKCPKCGVDFPLE